MTSQLAQEMVGEDAGILRDEVFVDQAEKAALPAVFSRPSALPLSATVRNYSATISFPPVLSRGLCNSLDTLKSAGAVKAGQQPERRRTGHRPARPVTLCSRGRLTPYAR